jgi:hypothetical protein
LCGPLEPAQQQQQQYIGLYSTFWMKKNTLNHLLLWAGKSGHFHNALEEHLARNDCFSAINDCFSLAN